MANLEAALFPIRRRAAVLFALTAFMTAPHASFGDQHDGIIMTCTNSASGASWQIRIDYGTGTVDSNPARISAGKIAWHDATDGGNYTLDRASGKLTVIVASSTGGYFLYHYCRHEN